MRLTRMTQEYYFKATRNNGESGYDSGFRYKLGMNIHPKPDKKSRAACGIGIHLAKTIEVALRFVSRASEIYLAKPGVILGEDDEKLRCGSCFLIKKLDKEEVEHYEKQSELRLPTNPICGQDWLNQHQFDISWQDFYNQTIVISSNNHTLPPISSSMKRKDLKVIIRNYVRV